MEDREFLITMTEIVDALQQAGYDPTAQLTGYLQTGDETYITRCGDARTKIRCVDKQQIRDYISANDNRPADQK